MKRQLLIAGISTVLGCADQTFDESTIETTMQGLGTVTGGSARAGESQSIPLPVGPAPTSGGGYPSPPNAADYGICSLSIIKYDQAIISSTFSISIDVGPDGYYRLNFTNPTGSTVPLQVASYCERFATSWHYTTTEVSARLSMMHYSHTTSGFADYVSLGRALPVDASNNYTGASRACFLSGFSGRLSGTSTSFDTNIAALEYFWNGSAYEWRLSGRSFSNLPLTISAWCVDDKFGESTGKFHQGAFDPYKKLAGTTPLDSGKQADNWMCGLTELEEYDTVARHNSYLGYLDVRVPPSAGEWWLENPTTYAQCIYR